MKSGGFELVAQAVEQVLRCAVIKGDLPVMPLGNQSTNNRGRIQLIQQCGHCTASRQSPAALYFSGSRLCDI
jgi:hypothetical protein